MGINSFIFIIDEYHYKFEFTFPQSSRYKILVVPGRSNHPNCVNRQRENYNLCLEKIDNEYVCVLDCDEFLHPDTLKFLKRYRPQSVNLPWRLMCLDIPEKRDSNGSYFRGFTVTQCKSISKVEDVSTIGLHTCKFNKKGRRIAVRDCLDIPVNHYYIRDSADMRLFQHKQSDIDMHFSGRIHIMYIIHAICIRFGDFSQAFKLSDCGQERLLIDRPNQLIKIINSDSIWYLYFYLGLLMRIEKFARLSINPRIRTYARVFNKLESIDTLFLKFLCIFLFIADDLTKKMSKDARGITRKYMLRLKQLLITYRCQADINENSS